MHTFCKLIVASCLMPMLAQAQVDHSCSDKFAAHSGLRNLSGAALASAGLIGIASPLVAEELIAGWMAKRFLTRVDVFREELRAVRRFKKVGLTAGSVSALSGIALLRGREFRYALRKALVEVENGSVGEYTRGLSVLVNYAIYSGGNNPSEVISECVDLSKALREELAGAMNNQTMTSTQMYSTLQAMIAEQTICGGSPGTITQWIERAVWTHTREAGAIHF